MDSGIIFKALCGIIPFIMFIYYIRREKKILSFLIGAITGCAALFIVNEYGCLIGISIPLNLFNIAGSAVLGAPFVLFLVIMNYL